MNRHLEQDKHEGILTMTGGGRFDFVFDDDKEVSLRVEFDSPEMASNAPLNQQIVMYAELDEGYLRVPTREIWFERIPVAPADIDTKHVHMLIGRMAPLDATDEEMEKLTEWAQERATEVKGLYRTVAGHEWDVDVRGIAFRTNSYGGPPFYCRKEIMAAYNEAPIEGFYPNYTHCIGQPHPKYNGQAGLGRNSGATYFHGGRIPSYHTTGHEGAHNLGAMHGQKLEVSQVFEYRDPSTLMGNHHQREYFNAVNLMLFGLANEDKIKVVTESSAHLLAPLELQPEALHPDEQQILIVRGKKRTEDIVISTRKIKGHPYALPSTKQFLYVHQNNVPASLLLSATRDSYVTEQGVEISVTDQQDETFEVVVDFPDGPDELAAYNFPEGFPQVPESQPPTPAMSGLWWNPDQSHQGLHLHVREDGDMGFIWYTFDSQGKLRYYTTMWNPDEVVEDTFAIYTTDNGTFDDPAQRDTVYMGDGQLYFTDEGNAVFNFNTTEHGRGTIRLNKLMDSTAEEDGWYYDPERGGEGFGVVTDPGIGRLVYWYTYTDEPNRGEQEWYVMDVDERNEAQVLRPNGGEFMKLTSSKLVSIDQADVKFPSKDHLDVYHTMHGGSGVRRCQRLF